MHRIFRTTAFKLTLGFLVLFAVGSIANLGYFYWHSASQLTEEIDSRTKREIEELERIFETNGLKALVITLSLYAQRPMGGIYALSTADGRVIYSNAYGFPEWVSGQLGWAEFRYRSLNYDEFSQIVGQRLPQVLGKLPNASTAMDHLALVYVQRLSNGLRLIVGTDATEKRRLVLIAQRSVRSGIIIVVLLGMIGGIITARSMLRRVDKMNNATNAIMEGNLSGRLEVGKAGDELDRLAIGVNLMLERLETLVNGVKQVSDNIAHDLKTPLTRLRNRTEEALNVKSSNEEMREALFDIQQECEVLIRTFDSLLMISRIEAQDVAVVLEPIDLAPILHDMAELYEVMAEEENLSFVMDIEENLTIHGHRELLGRVFGNLLDNALKYGKSSSEVAGEESKISLSGKRMGKNVIVSISDNGPGIPVNEREKAMERFYRLEKSRSKPGSGLGLSLVNAVVRKLHGTTLLEDNHPGLKVVLQFPFRPIS